jgi:hypothetical protein
MGARTKLNSAYAMGSLLVAVGLAAMTGSWWAFAAVAGIGLAFNVINGEIRSRNQ